MRILHVTWRLSRHGGIPAVIRRLCSDLDPSRFEVHVLTLRPPFAEDGLDDLGSDVRLHHLGIEGAVPAARRPGLVLRGASVVRRVDPQVIHAHSGTAVYALGALAAPGSARLLDVHDAPGRARHSTATERLEGLACRRLGFVPIAHSTSVRREVALAWRLREPDVRLVPLGVDTERFRGARRHADRLTVLYVARLAPSKDVDLLLDVVARLRGRPDLPPWRAVVIGSGPELPRLRARVAGEGLDDLVELSGVAVDDEALVEAYLGADVFVSTSRYEGFGLAVAEAMAAGVPIVAAAVGGVTDLVVDGQTGALVDGRDAAALADRVAALLVDPDRRRRLGEAARARAVERFDVARMVAGYARLYEELGGGR